MRSQNKTGQGTCHKYTTIVSYAHSLMSYKDLRATINPYSNRRSRKIKQYLLHFVKDIFKYSLLLYHEVLEKLVTLISYLSPI